ncbi:transposase [Hungatella hominis]|uniref:transposase n=1 Tax=Hungatella TaxID=1649459 RepID=UPI001FAB94CB|nr:transposase [Hungatella hominis]
MVSRAFSQFHETLEYKAALPQSEVLAAAPKCTSQSCPVYGNTTKTNRYRKRHESHVVLRVIELQARAWACPASSGIRHELLTLFAIF